MRRSLHVLLWIASWFTALPAQQNKPLDLVLESGQGRPDVVVDSVANDTLFGYEAGVPYRVPVADIAEIHGPVGTHVWTGAGVGFLVGSLGGIIWAAAENEPGWFLTTLLDSTKHFHSDLRVLGASLGGALVGAILGALLPQRDVYQINGAQLEIKLDAIQRALRRNRPIR